MNIEHNGGENNLERMDSFAKNGTDGPFWGSILGNHLLRWGFFHPVRLDRSRTLTARPA